MTIHWAGGFVSRHEVRRPVRAGRAAAGLPGADGAGWPSCTAPAGPPREIAEALNREGFRPPKRRETYNAAMVRQLLSRRGRSGPRPEAVTDDDPRGSDEWWLSDLSRELGMPQPTVH